MWDLPLAPHTEASPPAHGGTSSALHLLEVEVLEGEVSLHDAGGFNSGAQNVLLGGNVGRLGYSIQVIEVTKPGDNTRWAILVCCSP